MERSAVKSAQFAAALSTAVETETAVAEVCAAAMNELAQRPDLAMLFASPHHLDNFEKAARDICSAIGSDVLLGCTGESIIGGDREIEQAPAISLWLASLPGTTVTPMHLEFNQTPDGGTFGGWPADLPAQWPQSAAMLLLGEPFSFPADELLRRLNEDQQGVPLLGGMASGGMAPGENRLILGRQLFDSGAIAALVNGAIRIRGVVSQGCRPIGQPFVVTRAEANVIYELGGKPALVCLQKIYDSLSEQDKNLVRQGVHVGRVVSEYQDEFKRGDFLVRNVIGADPNAGAIAIGDFVRPGQTVQFHVRDESTADEDLRNLLRGGRQTSSDRRRGALLFTCNGRGTRLFSAANHDATCIREELGELPVAGLFAQGEIGPIGKQNFLHGFTASVALFEAGE
jgi:small ligand-binding sensory domain FIST